MIERDNEQVLLGAMLQSFSLLEPIEIKVQQLALNDISGVITLRSKMTALALEGFSKDLRSMGVT